VRCFHGHGSGRGSLRPLESSNGLGGAVDDFESVPLVVLVFPSPNLCNIYSLSGGDIFRALALIRVVGIIVVVDRESHASWNKVAMRPSQAELSAVKLVATSQVATALQPVYHYLTVEECRLTSYGNNLFNSKLRISITILPMISTSALKITKANVGSWPFLSY
jgi:hypothetical protein